jgi:phosphatidate cytidylyltransferase
MSELQVRVVSATVLIAASILGYLYLSEFLLITILSVVWLLMLHELFRHMNSLGKTVSGILWISCFIFFAFSGHMLSTKIPTFLYILYFIGLLYSLLQIFFFSHSKNLLMIFLLILFYILFGSLNLIFLIGLIGKNQLILAYILFVIAHDMGGYFFGKKYGKKKLSPMISPGKTLEGLVGSILFGVLVAIIYAAINDIQYIPLLIFSLAIVFISLLGDLIFSKLKRILNVKDFSKLIPGHGGLLDRLDSWIVSAPLAAYFLTYVTL